MFFFAFLAAIVGSLLEWWRGVVVVVCNLQSHWWIPLHSA